MAEQDRDTGDSDDQARVSVVRETADSMVPPLVKRRSSERLREKKLSLGATKLFEKAFPDNPTGEANNFLAQASGHSGMFTKVNVKAYIEAKKAKGGNAAAKRQNVEVDKQAKDCEQKATKRPKRPKLLPRKRPVGGGSSSMQTGAESGKERGRKEDLDYDDHDGFKEDLDYDDHDGY